MKPHPPSPTLKLIVITGATRGLGRALAESFSRGGHTVLGCGRDRAAVAKLAGAFAPPHDFAALDVADDAQVAAWAARLIAAHGAPDLLINNAAIILPTAPLWEQPAADFSRLIDVNVKGVVNVLRHFLPAILARGSGVIVNMSSGWGRSTSPGQAPYCASKFAVEGLTQALAAELPAGLSAIALNPGIIDTDMLRTCWADEAGGYPSAEEWAKTAAPFILGLGRRDNGRSLTVAG